MCRHDQSILPSFGIEDAFEGLADWIEALLQDQTKQAAKRKTPLHFPNQKTKARSSMKHSELGPQVTIPKSDHDTLKSMAQVVEDATDLFSYSFTADGFLAFIRSGEVDLMEFAKKHDRDAWRAVKEQRGQA